MSRAVRAPRSGTSARGTGRVARWGVWFRRLLTILLFLLVPLPLFFLLVFRFVPVPITPEILLKRATLQPTHQRWEPYLTVLLETLWPKKRILTAYLNLVDWGHGNYGAEAASEAYFHKSASRLSLGEAARLAAILPNPDAWRAAHPGPYVEERGD